MNFREERKARGWTLQEVADKTGYSVAAINGLEKRDEGGYELRVVLNRLYGNPEPVPYSELQDRSPPAFREESDLALWRRRAKAAEERVAFLENGMRRLLGTNIIPAGLSASSAGEITRKLGEDWDKKPAKK